MSVANSRFEATAEQYRKLARKLCNRDDIKKYIKLVLDVKDGDKMTHQLETKIGNIMACACDGRGTHGKTMWDAYNGVTEYLSHQAGRSADTRLESVWFGQAANMNENALRIAVQLAS